MKPILVIGNITCDVIVKIDHLPQVEDDLLVKNQEMQLGGCAFNVANMLHIHEYPYVLLSVVGSGLYGSFIQSELSKRNYAPLLNIEGEHGCCYCFVDQNGERTFMAYHSVEYTFNKEWLNDYSNTDFEYVYVCGLDIDEKCGEDIIQYLEGVQTPIFFAPGPSCLKISKDKMERIKKLRPILHVNEKEAKQLSNQATIEEALQYLYAQWNSTIIVTLGEKGSCAIDKSGIIYVPTTSCVVVDTIGAGDAHAACMLLKLAENKSLEESLVYANQMSREVVQKQGATLSLEEFDKIQ